LKLFTARVAAGDSPARLVRANLNFCMPRKYAYWRTLPHCQKENRALFITFATYHRWKLPEAARDLALEACVHANARKCVLHAAVIMPDHAHLVCTPLADTEGYFSIPEIMHAIKSESAHRINKALGRRGHVWQDESFDHVLRSAENLEEKIAYILANPVRAGLVNHAGEYRWFWPGPALSSQTA
jgi:REP-associated tyrosine transposase